MSILFLVATPIGNLEDMSPRAIRVLREVQLIAAEDTRHSRKLLTHFEIHTPLTSYYEHNQLSKLERVLAALAAGDVALISDAGMPGINDPGYLLVRAALQAGHQVSPVPGPSAPVAALAASGLPSDHFVYLGYLPAKASERRAAIEQVAALPYTLIWLESPHRLSAALADLQRVLGERHVAVAAELTKLYERFFRGTLSEAAAFYAKQPARGEFTLVVAGAETQPQAWGEEQVKSLLQAGLATTPPSQLAKQVAAESGWPRSQVYTLLEQLRKERIDDESE
ncbi:MAG: 16S rRNA (cytidine(1402)-2'-O)-methyltransferase [Anaerolineales bacterium]|nr:16S rRNA (cytidine(1402)-2'-O)-methyltransferase [Anaerolineales bacterium]MBX3004916.1 16S rRNA (cytidine(1402)-2'-O)-methyltransferase [Anaerolineales bacterium]MCW5839563.1 16S rRNA (cytidine(1402)-2'-O)-methyltransferase [Anaerolineales bacterium]